ncbi:hypothetical protein PIB30_006606 [Stylosanthes scabra]|uniref:DUF4283 domain-containing protein n=1 Tax=Stylosanthes scabra TaxID=79078 RepID=A0ABU6Z2W5_9FABA|nr:hypothetical protein [Stylosanthes scabra]
MASPDANHNIQPSSVSSADEEAVIVLDHDDICDGIDRCSKSLFGRIFADRSFSGGTIETALSSIWRQPDGFKVVDHGGNIFQFFFKEETDVIRIERGAPWLFKNYLLNLKRWEEDRPIEDADFIRGETTEEKWGEWLRSEQRGRRESALKENNNPNTQSDISSRQLKAKKHILVNLIKSLASLSVQSQPTIMKEDDDVISSKICSPNKKALVVSTVPEQQFIFSSSEGSSQNPRKKLSVKQQARRRIINISGTKRHSQISKEENSQKRRCSDEHVPAEEGEGATPQWAPNDP